MANVKICNLDVITPIQNRELVVGNISYEVKPLTVANFIELNLSRKKIGESDDMKKGLDLMTKIVKEFIPELPNAIIQQMSIQQLQMVLSFIFDEVPDEVLENKPISSESEDKAEESQGN